MKFFDILAGTFVLLSRVAGYTFGTSHLVPGKEVTSSLATLAQLYAQIQRGLTLLQQILEEVFTSWNL